MDGYPFPGLSIASRQQMAEGASVWHANAFAEVDTLPFDMEPFLPALDNVPVFIAATLLLLAVIGTSILSVWQRTSGAEVPLAALKLWVGLPTWLLFGGWLIIGAGLAMFAGAMGGSLGIILLAFFLGLFLLIGLSVVMFAWARSKPWADWFLIVSLGATILTIGSVQRLWICEPLAWGGLIQAQMCTAELYAAGEQGAIRNEGIAASWYGQAAKQGSEEAVYALLEVTRNKNTHRRLLETAADAGNGTAMYQLFILLGPTDGKSWLDKAIGIRHPDALYQQSRFLLTGEQGYALDPDRAQALLVEAATLGSTPASAELALAYERGDQGTGYSRSASLRWEGNVSRRWAGWSRFSRELTHYRELRDKAADGDPLAMLALAENYEQRARENPHYRADAELWFIKAADAGSTEAQFDMAFQYFRKPTATPDEMAAARRWLTAAADQGDHYALSNIAHYLTNGQYGFAIDLEQARAYGTRLIDVLEQDDQASPRDRRLAAERLARIEQALGREQAWTGGLDDLENRAAAGEAQAKYLLYEKHMQDNQRGDRELAFRLLEEAAELGHLEARYRVASRTFQQLRTEEEEARAYLWMADAADRGHRGALVFMGQLYERGSVKRGIEPDLGKAREFYQQALDGLEGEVIYQRKNGTRTVSMRRDQVDRALAGINAP